MKLLPLCMHSFGFACGLAQTAVVHSDPNTACKRTGQAFKANGVKVNLAQYVPAGTNLTLPTGYDTQSCGYTAQVVSVDLCRITINVATSNRSETFLEAWLPSNYTGRYLTTGNGGLGGCVSYEDMAYTASLGFATVGTNNGHNGSSGAAFAGNPDILADYVYRAIHIGTVIGKNVAEAHYRRKHSKSYYLGSSTGGRQGFKEAQDFPEDFDGIIAGCPAIGFNNLTAWAGRFLTVTGPANSSTSLSFDEWGLVHDDILSQCDTLDGVADGILEDPEFCAYRPVTLQCPRANKEMPCLTASQVETVRQVFADYHGIDGSLIFPAMNYGSEIIARLFYYGGQPFSITQDWYRYVVYNDPTWNPASLSIKDAAFTNALNPFNVDTWKGDLSAFQKRGGRLIHWHGLEDAIITSANSARYYNHVTDTMAMSPSQLDEFYRLFRISGMDHYSGGVGAWGIGNTGRVAKGGEPQTPDNNVLLRLVDWVENGRAPETLTGYKYINDTTSLGVAFTRKHCKYPLRNTCVDPQNYEKAEAWQCV